jgi:hypothetical protein
VGKQPKLTVGKRVRLKLGAQHVTGVVIEDRGRLGARGVQIVRVRVKLSDIDETMDLEVPATDVTPIAA